MDPGSLALILRATCSVNQQERKAAEESFSQSECTPQHLLRLLQIIMSSDYDLTIRHLASIHFKNFVAKNWSSCRSGVFQKISENDKDIVREKILGFILQVHPLLRAQLAEGLKTIIHADYPEKWSWPLYWIRGCLQLPDHQLCGALNVLKILSRKYEVRCHEERMPLNLLIDKTFPRLLTILEKLTQVVNPTIEVGDMIKLICKIFWSSTYLEFPKHLFDPNIFNAWMILFLNILERPVPLDGQPTDPESRKSWEWWKVKKWTIMILNRLYTRFGDTKLRKPRNTVFFQMFQKNYAGKILECYLSLLNTVRVGEYLPDRVVNLILQYLISSIENNEMYLLLQPHLGIVLLEIIYPLMCFNDDDAKLWNEDPYEYVRRGYDDIEDLYSPRIAAMNFLRELAKLHGNGNVQKLIQFIVEIFRRYDEASIETKPYRQKDGALLVIGVLSDKLKQTECYKSELELMLVRNVFPEFKSHIGHLRAKAAWVAGQYAHFNFSDQNNFHQAFHCVILGLRDSQLPVRVDSVLALRSFIEACKDLSAIRPILPQLLDEIFKLMNDIENEDLVLTLEAIVVKFGEEMAPYSIGLCHNLAASFWRLLDTSEADGPGALAAIGCLRAISTILESISMLPHVFVQIEPILLPILRKMLTKEGKDVFEEVLEIVSLLTSFSPTISLELWSLWPMMVEALGDWAIDFFGNILVPLDNYISRSTSHFLTCRDPDYQQSLWNILSSIMLNRNIQDGLIESAPKLIEVVFQNCKGQVDQWVEPYLKITIERLCWTRKSYLKCLLIQVIANALYYDASLTLRVLQRLEVVTYVFSLWFQMLQQLKSNGVHSNFRRKHDKKICCLGLTSLLSLPADWLSEETFDLVFKAIIELLVAYKDQVTEFQGEHYDADVDDDDDDDDDMDGLQTDEVENNESEQEMAEIFQSDKENVDLDDDYSDDEVSQSPIDPVDPFILFMETIQGIQASNVSRINRLIHTLDSQSLLLITGIAQHADQRRLEMEKEKLKKATTR
ncbi:hypothetical protein J5N97_007329 [Dioscorea zingiberensis]|uniref:Importin N-terminal domain-containing protein n=1 Tax=Dioscorea zingiberensis TaxID=325984 RepID=A0A9D5DDC8_9LILI|nr:hypothetical protein J5N97_007329 [Dioscorea zingiberensis]